MKKLNLRRSIRLRGYDYSRDGDYFITICTKQSKKLFGEFFYNDVILSKIGEIVKSCWYQIPEHYPDVVLDEFVIMRDHIHGIIKIRRVNDNCFNIHEKENRYQHIIPRSVGAIVRGFKIGVAKRCRQNGLCDVVWQRNFYERVIRNDNELEKIRWYIRNNIRRGSES